MSKPSQATHARNVQLRVNGETGCVSANRSAGFAHSTALPSRLFWAGNSTRRATQLDGPTFAVHRTGFFVRAIRPGKGIRWEPLGSPNEDQDIPLSRVEGRGGS